MTLIEKSNITVNMETLAIYRDGVEVDVAISKSQMFELLYTEGLTVAEIKQLTGAHYSFIFGVVSKKCEKRETTKGSGKADEIRNLFQQGLTVSEISKKLDTNYSYVHTVVKKWKMANLDFVPADQVEVVVEKEVEEEAPMTPFERAALESEEEVVEVVEEAPKKKATKKEMIMTAHEQGYDVEAIAEMCDTTIKYVKNTIKAATK